MGQELGRCCHGGKGAGVDPMKAKILASTRLTGLPEQQPNNADAASPRRRGGADNDYEEPPPRPPPIVHTLEVRVMGGTGIQGGGGVLDTGPNAYAKVLLMTMPPVNAALATGKAQKQVRPTAHTQRGVRLGQVKMTNIDHGRVNPTWAMQMGFTVDATRSGNENRPRHLCLEVWDAGNLKAGQGGGRFVGGNVFNLASWVRLEEGWLVHEDADADGNITIFDEHGVVKGSVHVRCNLRLGMVMRQLEPGLQGSPVKLEKASVQEWAKVEGMEVERFAVTVDKVAGSPMATLGVKLGRDHARHTRQVVVDDVVSAPSSVLADEGARPLEAEGVVAGDIVETINGNELGEMDLEDIERALAKTRGELKLGFARFVYPGENELVVEKKNKNKEEEEEQEEEEQEEEERQQEETRAAASDTDVAVAARTRGLTNEDGEVDILSLDPEERADFAAATASSPKVDRDDGDGEDRRGSISSSSRAAGQEQVDEEADAGADEGDTGGTPSGRRGSVVTRAKAAATESGGGVFSDDEDDDETSQGDLTARTGDADRDGSMLYLIKPGNEHGGGGAEAEI